MTTPAIYNRLRDRKRATLTENLAGAAEDMPIVVGCPSCKMGIQRILMRGQCAGSRDARPDSRVMTSILSPLAAMTPVTAAMCSAFKRRASKVTIRRSLPWPSTHDS